MTATASAVGGLNGDETLAALFFTEEGIADPAPLYHQLRTTAPVHRSGTGAVFLTRFDDCDRLLRDNRFGKEQLSEGGNLIPLGDEAAVRFRREWRERLVAGGVAESMLFLDPPQHTRQRRLVARAFSPMRVEALRGSIRGLAQELVGAFVAAGGGDVLERVAFPLPVAVIGTMVGVPEADWPRFRSLVTTAAAQLEPGASLEDLQRAEAAEIEIAAYFKTLVAQRRADPRDDLLSYLIAVEEAGDTLTEAEVIAVANLLFGAGFETTTNLIGNGMGALLASPSEYRRLRADPALIPSAVDEMLRWDSPIQVDARQALEPAEVGGCFVDQGQSIVTLLGAANRDPERFSDPDRFDITRDEGLPLSFASGIHYCLGANLARAEGQEVFRALAERCRAIEPAGELVRRSRMAVRGFQAVPMTVQ